MGFNPIKTVGDIIAAPVTVPIKGINAISGPGKTGPNNSGNKGTYGEGNVADALQQLNDLKSSVQSGKTSLADYQDQAAKIVAQAAQITQQISGSGGKAASAVNPIWNQIVSGGFASPVNGKWTAPLPFSKQEYAKLPNSVLPTQDQINQGLFDPATAPLQRVQTATPSAPSTPATPGAPTPTDKPATPTLPNGTAQAPQPTFTPSNPAGNNPQTGVAPVTGNSQVQGSPVYSASPNNPGPNGGLVVNGTQASQDSSQVANEAALQQQLATQSQQGITAQRAKYLQDLTGVLNQNAQNQLNDQAPGIYEDLNSRGLLRSSALGNSMATAAKSLTANTTNQLEQQAIAGETSDLGNYTTIQNNYDQARNSALQRQFSVEDYNNQIQAGKALGDSYANLKPQTPSTKDQATVAAAGGTSTALATKAGK